MSQATDKVPTVIVYKENKPISWGFKTSEMEEIDDSGENNTHYHEWFKTLLDPSELERQNPRSPDGVRYTHLDVKSWIEDFLSFLCRHVEEVLSDRLDGPRWSMAKVVFIFSVPTTWKSFSIIEDFRALIKRAGFGKGGPKHTVEIGLTEAEAAAVYAAKSRHTTYRDGDIILVVDAGGGTTDISLLQTSASGLGTTNLEQLDSVRGANVGSTAVDMLFEDLVRQRLKSKGSSNGREAASAALKMTRSSQFQNYKTEFGMPDSNLEKYKIKIPKISYDFVDRANGIENGKLSISYHELRRMFDEQIEKITSLIDNQLNTMNIKHPSKQVTYLVLSGGLGSSAYVRAQLKSRYEFSSSPHPSARQLRVLDSDSGQLAVVQGLLHDRQHVYTLGRPILSSRCSRASYGVLCNAEYDKKRHVGLETEVSRVDEKIYAKDLIRWFVKAGEPVSTEKAIDHRFFRYILPKDDKRIWNDVIVKSELEGCPLPQAMSHGGVKVVCTVQSNLTGVEEDRFKKCNLRWWKHKKFHYRVEYTMKALLGAADLRFELWFDGQRFGENDEPIRVEWAPAKTDAVSPTVSSEEPGIDMGL